MRTTKEYWDSLKEKLDTVQSYSYEDTRNLLLKNNFYKTLEGKAKNRTLAKTDIKLFKSIYEYTEKLEQVFRIQKAYKSNYNFFKRILFIVDYNLDVEKLRCSCTRKYSWTGLCRHCPDTKASFLGKKHTEETRKKQRLSTLRYLEDLKGQLAPRYNKSSIKLIEEFGLKEGYKFMHAENGGEFFIKELGYFVDAYDPINNVVLEVDEKHHFSSTGQLKDRDRVRQEEITKLLKCKFLRIRYD
jgi:hypothetical protein